MLEKIESKTENSSETTVSSLHILKFINSFYIDSKIPMSNSESNALNSNVKM